jgi:hypothetical protein
MMQELEAIVRAGGRGAAAGGANGGGSEEADEA